MNDLDIPVLREKVHLKELLEDDNPASRRFIDTLSRHAILAIPGHQRYTHMDTLLGEKLGYVYRPDLFHNLARYHILERYVSQEELRDHVFFDEEPPTLDEISVPEFFERFGNSISYSKDRVSRGYLGGGGVGFLVIDLERALPEERRKAIENGQNREARGTVISVEREPLLDVGMIGRRGQMIPAEAIIGNFFEHHCGKPEDYLSSVFSIVLRNRYTRQTEQ